MNDQAVIDRLRTALDELTSEIDDDIPAFDDIDPAPPARRDPRRWLVLAAAASLIVVAAAGVWLATRGPRPDGTAATDPTPASPAPAAPVQRLPVPPRPEGWKVVEFGDVRLSVPPAWEATQCDGEPEAATLTLCGRGESYVTLRPEQLDGVTATETRNGLEVKYRHADCTPARDQPVLCDSLDLVDLDVRVEAVSTDPDTVDGILRSVGVSGRWRAEHEPLPPVPDGWQEVETNGVTFSVPRAWTTLDLTDTRELPPAACGSQLADGLVIFGPSPLDVDCPPSSSIAELVAGVWVGPTTELLGTWPAWDEVVDVDGTPLTVRVGFGEDALTALAIIGSIHATPEPSRGSAEPGSIAELPPTGTQIFDALDIELIFESREVGGGGELASAMHVVNDSGDEVVDADCRLRSGAFALNPPNDPTATLWLPPAPDCEGPFVMPDGFSGTFDGPTFSATTPTGDPLPPGEYVAVLDIDGRSDTLRYPITVSRPGNSSPDENRAGWHRMPQAPIGSRVDAAAVVTPDEFVIWGGRVSPDELFADGVAYSFADRTWRRLAPSPLSPRHRAIAVWTGQEVLILGGLNANDQPLFDGAAWNPRTATWREIATPTAVGAVAGDSGAVWTGRELVVVGVRTGPNEFVPSDTVALDPSGGDWRPLDPTPWASDHEGEQPRGRRVVFTGEDVLVVTMADNVDVTIDRLDPTTGGWAPTVTTSLPGLDVGPDGVVWTGAKLVIANHLGAGTMFDPADDSLTPIDSSESSHRYPAVALDSGVVTVGDRWLDGAEGSWHDADPIPEPFREFPVAGGHGDTFYVWGGDACGPAASCTALVDPGPGLAWTAAAS